MQELLNVKAAGTYSDHSALKGKVLKQIWNKLWRNLLLSAFFFFIGAKALSGHAPTTLLHTVLSRAFILQLLTFAVLGPFLHHLATLLEVFLVSLCQMDS
jgi:hypothetical protein